MPTSFIDVSCEGQTSVFCLMPSKNKPSVVVVVVIGIVV
jgi:hypothetical protein